LNLPIDPLSENPEVYNFLYERYGFLKMTAETVIFENFAGKLSIRKLYLKWGRLRDLKSPKNPLGVYGRQVPDSKLRPSALAVRMLYQLGLQTRTRVVACAGTGFTGFRYAGTGSSFGEPARGYPRVLAIFKKAFIPQYNFGKMLNHSNIIRFGSYLIRTKGTMPQQCTPGCNFQKKIIGVLLTFFARRFSWTFF
jgi:hypothetical protein